MDHIILAYLNTVYIDASTGFSFLVGSHSKAYQNWGKQYGSTFCYVTPYNPLSVMLPQKENADRLLAFEQEIKQRNLICRKAYSHDQEGRYKEYGAFIFDLPYNSAIRLGQKWGQRAIVFGGRFCYPELVICSHS